MPTPTSSPFAWQRLGTIATSAQLGGIAASLSGYVVLEFPRRVWFSPDGRTWTKAILPFESGTSNGVKLRAHANEITGSPGGFVVVGGYDQAPCTENAGAGGPGQCPVAPISWVSSDGLTWRSSQSTPMPSDGSNLPDSSEMVRAWPAGDGWDAAVEVRYSVIYYGNKLLHSSDGLAWTRLKAAPLPEGVSSGDEIHSHAGVATPSGQRLLWQVRFDVVPTDSTLSTSADGASWTRVQAFDGAGMHVRLGLGPEGSDAGPWLVMGDVFDGESLKVTWWLSEDLVTWHTGQVGTADAHLQGISGLARWAGGYIALGRIDEDEEPETWLSADGSTWSEIVGPEPGAFDAPVFLAAGPAGLIGVGRAESGSQAWLGVDLTN